VRALVCVLALAAACGREQALPAVADNLVSDAVCVGCHTEQATYFGTAHHLTSSPASRETILGSFHEGENILRTVNPRLHYRMDARPDGFFQSVVMGIPPDTTVFAERFDLVIGSGRKGQTYLYWRDEDLLYQLPVSYWTELGEWAHSPRFHEGAFGFAREVGPRCVECHATYFPRPPGATAPHQYDPSGAVLGISCQTCHGGGSEHVARQGSWRAALFGERIVNPARLSRERQIDACALCHGGVGEPIAPAFTYVPGRPLAEHVRQPVPPPFEAVDVHGNQVALLGRSPCFQASEMTCNTCHNVHETQRDPAAFSATCLTCHQPQSCGLFPEHGLRLAENCVGCHMPDLPSIRIASRHDGRSVRPTVRSHWIRVYAADELSEAVGVPF
jgi:hypothetical protein